MIQHVPWLLLLLSLGLAGCAGPAAEQTQTASTGLLSPEDRYGELFEAVQMGRVFPDSKTFADCTPRTPDAEILAAYEAQKGQEGFSLEAFVNEHFELPRQYASGFEADTGRTIDEHIMALWPVLTRQADQENAGTLISLPHPYIVPGGRFGEIYYWDSYFTMLGLDAAGMTDMIRHMIDNFAYLIDTVGHIPNGNRTYFLSRSQPPFFSLMVALLAEKDPEARKRYAASLDKEYRFWMYGQAEQTPGEMGARAVQLPGGEILNRYWDGRPEPRPESYKEDVELAESSGRDPQQLYRDLRAACESGWDFSSRWFRDGQNLATIHTTEILPVDLNCLLYHLEVEASKAGEAIGNAAMASEYQARAEARKAAIQKYFWDEETGFFMDYDFVKGAPTGRLSLGGVFPLFLGLATPEQAASVARVVERDFLRPGGVVTTPVQSGQQWDDPNGWAPLQWVTIQGLRNYQLDALANEIRDRWVALNTRVYRNTGKMVEKYNVLDMDLEAGGGEYPVQDGFGWSNGVMLKLKSEWWVAKNR